MNIARKITITVAATAISIGLLGVSAPAQARDSSWGYSSTKASTK